MKKQVINVGKGIAMNAISKQLTGDRGETEEKRIVLSTRTGERFIKYSDYDIVKFMEPVGEEEYGFIKLHNSKYIDESYEDILLFFGNRTDTKKEASQLYEFIKRKISENKKELSESMPHGEDKVIIQKAPESSSADEILKYKQLFDMCAITQEEYNAKKKQLLGL